MERTKNSIKGIISGFINKFVLLLLPFFVRTVFINTLGIKYLGLNSLFSSILNILNLAELGVGSAISYSMYSAIAKKDTERIRSLEFLYKRTYRIIGLIVLGIGICTLPFVKFICNGDIPSNINIYILFLMHLLNSSLTYFLFSYKNCILSAHQQNYIVNNVNTVINTILSVLQIVVLLLGGNYYFYLFLIILSTIFNNLIIAYFAHKRYPQYYAEGEIDSIEKKQIYNKVKALFFYKIGGIVLSSVDSIVITYYLGLTVLGNYNNYYYVITALFGFIQIINGSMVAGIGNSIVSETVEKNKSDFDKIFFFQSWLICFCTISLLCLYQNFMFIWLGKNHMFEFMVVILLSVYFYVWKMMETVNLYKEAAGLWEFDKYRPLVASAINLVLNIILVNYIGIYGIILSTIISIVCVIFPWSTYILFREYFKKGYFEYLKKIFINFIITIIIAIMTYYICSIFGENNFKNLIFRMIVCIIIPNLYYLLFYFKTKIFSESFKWILEKLKIAKYKIKLLKLFKVLWYISIGIFSLNFINLICFLINKI